MMLFTDAQIEQMRAYDIHELLPAGVELRGKNNRKGACPFCGTGKDRFCINVKYWYCGCSCIPKNGGTAIDFVMMRDGCDFSAAIDTLGALLNLRPLQERDAKIAAGARQHQKQTTRPKMQTDTPADLTPLLPTITAANRRLIEPTTDKDRAARDALYMRGVTDIEIERYQLGYLPTWAKVGDLSISPKIIIPRFVDGKLCGVNSKTYAKQPKPKYLFTGKRGVFNGDGIETADNIIVVEGEFDAILLSRFTTAHVITLGGSNHTLSSSEKLSLSFASNIYSLFDGDEAGQNGTAKLTAVLGSGRVQSLPIEPGMDITDIWQRDGDNGVIALLPAAIRIPSTIDCTDLWIGKKTDIGIVQVVLGDGQFLTTNGNFSPS